MVRSMTGYGRAAAEFEGTSYTVDIKSLNGRSSELRMKNPLNFKSKELEIRKMVMDRLNRGKVDLIITASSSQVSDTQLNMKLVEHYYTQLATFVDKHQLANQDFLQTIIRIPNVFQSLDNEINDTEWDFVKNLVTDAVDQLDNFRIAEGVTLSQDLINRTNKIEELLLEIPNHESQRKEDLVGRLNKTLEESINSDKIDANRFEQELVYYLEKLDLHEEKVRLQQHCNFFRQAIESEEFPGKKLNFISQEMGREINTIGSKAQFTAIQQLVVDMKVELDQIKEQLANAV